MTTEPQTDPIATLTDLQATLQQANAQTTGAKAAVMAVLAQPPVDTAALQAKLDALQVAYDAKHAEMKQQSAERKAQRAEAWAWRKLAGVIYDPLVPMTPAEVAAKKPLGGSSTPSTPKRGAFQAVSGLAVPDRLKSRLEKVSAWQRALYADNFKGGLGEDDRARFLQDYTYSLIFNVYWLGHTPSLLALADVWAELLGKNPALFAELNALEGSIATGPVKVARYVLRENAGADKRVDTALELLEAHRPVFDVAMAQHKDKALLHAALGEYVGYGAEALMGDAEAAKKRDYLGAALAADFDFVTAPDGKEILVVPHGVQRLYKDYTGTASHDFAHWSVYFRTSMSNLELGALLGLPLMSERVLAAAARAMYWTLPTQGGPGAEVFSKDMAGGPLPIGVKQRSVHFRDGTTTPGRWKATAASAEGQGVHSFQRALSHISAYRAPELLPKWKEELEALDARAVGPARHGVQQALLNIEIGGKRLL